MASFFPRLSGMMLGGLIGLAMAIMWPGVGRLLGLRLPISWIGLCGSTMIGATIGGAVAIITLEFASRRERNDDTAKAAQYIRCVVKDLLSGRWMSGSDAPFEQVGTIALDHLKEYYGVEPLGDLWEAARVASEFGDLRPLIVELRRYADKIEST